MRDRMHCISSATVVTLLLTPRPNRFRAPLQHCFIGGFTEKAYVYV